AAAGHHAAGADHGPVTDAHAGEDQRAAADPGILADLDRPAVFPAAALLRVQRMQRREDLHAGAEQREAADAHRADIEHHAVEVEEDALAEFDVGAVVAPEGRLHPDAVAAPAEQLAQDLPPRIGFRIGGGIQRAAEVAGIGAGGDEIRI